MSLNIAQQFMKEMEKIFWSIKNSGEILNKLKSRGFLSSGLSTYDFSTLYEGLDGGVWYSLFIKNSAHYSSH